MYKKRAKVQLLLGDPSKLLNINHIPVRIVKRDKFNVPSLISVLMHSLYFLFYSYVHVGEAELVTYHSKNRIETLKSFVKWKMCDRLFCLDSGWYIKPYMSR